MLYRGRTDMRTSARHVDIVLESLSDEHPGIVDVSPPIHGRLQEIEYPNGNERVRLVGLQKSVGTE